MDRFLATAQTDLSRSRLQMLIREGRVQVNDVAARPSQKLRDGDLVRIELPEPQQATLEAEDLPIDVVFEDEHLMVIDKPAGLVVHPGAGVRRGTLVHALLHHAPGIAGVGGEGRPGIVHRLDRDTTGLMVVAKTQRAHRALVAAIQERRVARIYQALVWGVPRFLEGTIDAPLGRDPRDRRRIGVIPEGRPARTHWRTIERLEVATLLELKLDTGRTHQIRVHLAHLGHPVVGDPVYEGRGKKQLRGGESQRSLAAVLLECLKRQALHAIELGLEHPVTGDRLHFTRPVPDDFARALDHLRSRPTSAPASNS